MLGKIKQNLRRRYSKVLKPSHRLYLVQSKGTSGNVAPAQVQVRPRRKRINIHVPRINTKDYALFSFAIPLREGKAVSINKQVLETQLQLHPACPAFIVNVVI